MESLLSSDSPKIAMTMAVPDGAPNACGIGKCTGGCKEPVFNSKYEVWTVQCATWHKWPTPFFYICLFGSYSVRDENKPYEIRPKKAWAPLDIAEHPIIFAFSSSLISTSYFSLMFIFLWYFVVDALCGRWKLCPLASKWWKDMAVEDMLIKDYTNMDEWGLEATCSARTAPAGAGASKATSSGTSRAAWSASGASRAAWSARGTGEASAGVKGWAWSVMSFLIDMLCSFRNFSDCFDLFCTILYSHCLYWLFMFYFLFDDLDISWW